MRSAAGVKRAANATITALKKSVRNLDAEDIREKLDAAGSCVIPGFAPPGFCREQIDRYDDDARYRNTVVMARHGFGSGEYRYYDYPLPPPIEFLRTAAYPVLAPIANEWSRRMGGEATYPAEHAEFVSVCAGRGQTKPTPLILKYEAGDYNCLHQDLYGETVFPLQLAILLSEPGEDFTGGEFVMTEQRPRMQSRPHVAPLRRGDAVIFPVRHRPKRGARGDYRVAMRHGVSEVLSGRRFTLGVIFHDAA